MMKKSLERLAKGFIVLCIIVGGFLGLSIAGVKINFEIAASIIVGPLIAILFMELLSLWHRKRNGKIPELDERSIMILKRYFLIVLYVVLIGSSAVLLLLYAMGVHKIETGMLIAYMGALYLLIGIGAWVALKV